MVKKPTGADDTLFVLLARCRESSGSVNPTREGIDLGHKAHKLSKPKLCQSQALSEGKIFVGRGGASVCGVSGYQMLIRVSRGEEFDATENESLVIIMIIVQIRIVTSSGTP